MAFYEDEAIVALILLFDSFEDKEKEPKKYMRSYYKNREQGAVSFLRGLEHDDFHHRQIFRMGRSQFDLILTKIGPRIGKENTHAKPITPIERLVVTLRYLITGQSMTNLSEHHRISKSSLVEIIREVCNAIREEMAEFVKAPNKEAWRSIALEFERKWHYPNCIGALDGKHVKITRPPLSGTKNYNYKGHYSVVLMALAGPNYEFLLFDHGADGSTSDGGVYRDSEIKKAIEVDSSSLPPMRVFENGYSFPPVIVADDAFALTNRTMKPFPGVNLSITEKIFNYRLSRARMVVENTFGIWSARFRLFLNTVHCQKEDLINSAIGASIVLHNFLKTENELSGLTADTIQNGCFTPGSWRKEVNAHVLDGLEADESCRDISGQCLRNQFAEFFMTETGSVSWQYKHAFPNVRDN